ncbi:ectonucleotide pyrophosphatase/phosphodiesterase [Sphingomonas rubra]|uniref:Predicted pyrophosphatase or phosphodiesterase, AlkP superfamily n=1 Tax=Sphingomonas rubra TaxID=634430 RepID=A0A1I5UFC6_9SPHN|nr:ectonucleotide pyrophosphatase/phosphodiesterase [Sphingomonas rubra]SFP93951.1 Predicted pyrophosphatase or phosphodiesterase, AlkP superfamily [Sphingomonas rubra]
MKSLFAPLAAALALGGCTAYPYTPPALAPVTRPAPPVAVADPVAAEAPVTILISIDGFRPDYLDRGVTPHLSRLARDGVTASMRPSFPSKTFPNHWTLVTGLVPDHHGIVANNIDDPTATHPSFTMATDDPWWWNAAEPIWVTAEKAGIRTATMFWPGSTVAWGSVREEGGHHRVAGGTRPKDWQQFNQAVTGDQRVDAVIDWLRRPAATRPRLVTLYFDTVDTAGHQDGPDSPGVTAAVADVDRSIGRLITGLAELGLRANLVIVADHGMAATSSTRTVLLDRILAPGDATIGETGPYAGIMPVPGHEAAVERALSARHPHMQCWRKDRIPARFRYGSNPRVPAWLCLAETGWSILKTAPTEPFAGGNHGYDNQAPEMRALFIAHGPAFAEGKRLPAFDNVDVAPLLRDLIGLPANPRLDGSDAPFRKVLR